MNRPSKLRRAVFGCLIALMVLAGAEAALRVVGFRFQKSLSYMKFNFPEPNTLHNIFVPDPVLLWRLRPGYDFGEGFPPLNQQGYRGPEFTAAKPSGVVRVACLGDSVTFGGPHAAYPDLLAELLGPGYEVMNFGVVGYSSLQGRRLLPAILHDYHPDLVIILFGWNDHWLAQGFADKQQVVSDSPATRWLDLLRELRLYQFMSRLTALAAGRAEQPPRVLRVSPEDYRENLEAMARACREAGAQPIMLTAPSAIGTGAMPDFLTYLHFVNSREELVRLHAEYNDLVRGTAADLGIDLIDLDRTFEAADLASLFDAPDQDLVHPNPQGYQLFARELAGKIKNKEGSTP